MSWTQFATFPETVSWVRLRRHLDVMPGGGLVDVACDRMNEAALVFVYRGHRFGVDLHEDAFRFSVEDANCPEDVRRDVLAHAEQLVKPRRDERVLRITKGDPASLRRTCPTGGRG